MTKHMPRLRRSDGNQTRLTKAARDQGAAVALIHTVGQGVPDALLGILGLSLLIEIKDAKGDLTPDETKWWDGWTDVKGTAHPGWQGQVTICRSEQDIADLIEIVQTAVKYNYHIRDLINELRNFQMIRRIRA